MDSIAFLQTAVWDIIPSAAVHYQKFLNLHDKNKILMQLVRLL